MGGMRPSGQYVMTGQPGMRMPGMVMSRSGMIGGSSGYGMGSAVPAQGSYPMQSGMGMSGMSPRPGMLRPSMRGSGGPGMMPGMPGGSGMGMQGQSGIMQGGMGMQSSGMGMGGMPQQQQQQQQGGSSQLMAHLQRGNSMPQQQPGNPYQQQPRY